jgi:anti-sigma B factor antagonist
MLSYSSHDVGGVLVFTVDEATEDEDLMSQREWLYKTIESRENPLFVVDLAAINYMASSDIGLLITIKRRVDLRKGKIALVNIDPFILDIFRTMRIDKLFTIAPDVTSAVATLSA